MREKAGSRPRQVVNQLNRNTRENENEVLPLRSLQCRAVSRLSDPALCFLMIRKYINQIILLLSIAQMNKLRFRRYRSVRIICCTDLLGMQFVRGRLKTKKEIVMFSGSPILLLTILI